MWPPLLGNHMGLPLHDKFRIRTNIQSIRATDSWEDQTALGADAGKMVMDGDGDGWGYNLGALLDVNESVSLGFAYRSSSTVNIHGTATLSGIAACAAAMFTCLFPCFF
ncbi:MAG: hypothetical protein FD174_102 [Geobacteraceae bacterium]|nr:MAG: hypothetical protein FD174_102 [Geobacteraceae bacterium]